MVEAPCDPSSDCPVLVSHLPWLKASQLGSWWFCSLQLQALLGLLYHLFPQLSVSGSITLICIAQKTLAENTTLFWTPLDTHEEARVKQ